MEITIEELQKKFESLPENLKWAIMAANVDDNIIEIGKEQGLNVAQMGQLSLETHMVMFGYTHPDEFEKSVKASMGLPDDKTRAIVDAVNEKILKEIREKMGAPAGAPEETGGQIKINIIKPASVPNEIMPVKKVEINPIPQKMGPMIPILSQKLSAPVQSPGIQTDHSLGNLSKPTPKKDPYRELPE